MPCRIIVDRRFRCTGCLQHHTTRMKEATRTSETSVDNYYTRQYISEDNSELHTRRREKLKSQTVDLLTSWIIASSRKPRTMELPSATQCRFWAASFRPHATLLHNREPDMCDTLCVNHNWRFSFTTWSNLHPREHPLYMTSNFLVLMTKEAWQHTP
jgi:hypothetical protein